MKPCFARFVFLPAFLLPLGVALPAVPGGTPDLGIFEAQGDVGQVSHAGSTVFTATDHVYVIAGGGENMWFTNDAFHFVWKKVSGDFALGAAIDWVGAGGNPHRKACLLVRQDLTPGSPYVDVAVHGDGLTSLQFRETPNGATHEVQANVKRPTHVGVERQGNVFFMTLPGGEPSGAFIRLKFTDPVYVGLGVCSHDDKVTEQARFTDVQLHPGGPSGSSQAVVHCALEIVPIGSKDRRVVYHTTDLDERRPAPLV